MRIAIENEQLKAEIDSFGAELKSVIRKSDNQEYMWEADPAYWGKTAPVLFPFIGKLENCTFSHNGKIYAADKHGFAREMEFKVTEQEADRVVFTIESNEETLERYPFEFVLELEYRLNRNTVTQKWRLYNKGSETLYCSMGGHPGFVCPLIKDGGRSGKRTDCFIKLSGVDGRTSMDSMEVNLSTGQLSGEVFTVDIKDGVFPIADHIFDKDALLFADQGVTAVSLLDAEGKEYVRTEAPGCPVWGIWSMPTSDAPYVCIEPWWGCCDKDGYQGELKDRPYTNSVKAGEVWTDGLRIVIAD